MVYIGKNKYKYGRMIMSHMGADTLDQLHGMAFILGIDEKHFQDKKGKPHYDICQSKKSEALKYANVKEVSDKELIKLWLKLLQPPNTKTN